MFHCYLCFITNRHNVANTCYRQADAARTLTFWVFEKNNKPKKGPKLHSCTVPVCMLAGSSGSCRYVCLWFVVSVTTNPTQIIPQVSVIAQEMLSPPIKKSVSVCLCPHILAHTITFGRVELRFSLHVAAVPWHTALFL